MKPKILLINPPQTRYKESYEFTLGIPIGLLQIAAEIEEIAEVKIFDALIESFEIKKKGKITYFGTPIHIILEEIKRFNPTIVGISIPYTTQRNNAISLANKIKKINRNIFIIFGGPEPSISYEILLKSGSCDLCVLGEGELVFSKIITSINSNKSFQNISNIAYKEKDNIIITKLEFIKNLDSLKLPAYHLIEFKKYFKHPYYQTKRSLLGRHSITIITSRGCPYNCIFCSIKFHMGNKFRAQSPKYVFNHIKHLYYKYKVRDFHIEDDNFTLDKIRTQEILKKIIKNNLKIRWDTPNGVRADKLDKKTLTLIKESGCKHIIIAIESGDQKILDNIIKKRTNLTKIIEIIKIIHNLKIRSSAFYIIGLPGETLKDMKTTTHLAKELFKKYDLYPEFNIATPLPKTELYEICKEKNYLKKEITPETLSKNSKSTTEILIETEEFMAKDLSNIMNDFENTIKIIRIIYYIKQPLYTIKRIIITKKIEIERFWKFTILKQF